AGEPAPIGRRAADHVARGVRRLHGGGIPQMVRGRASSIDQGGVMRRQDSGPISQMLFSQWLYANKRLLHECARNIKLYRRSPTLPSIRLKVPVRPSASQAR